MAVTAPAGEASTTLPGAVVAVAFVAAAWLFAWANPAAGPALAAATLVYAALLWRMPALWLALLPAILATLNLAPWSGWNFADESDPFVIATLGVLAARAPPCIGDLALGRAGTALITTLVLTTTVGVALGLATPGLPGGSANPYLMPQNAWRISKGIAIGLGLLPFLLARARTHGDVLTRLGYGMCLAVAAISLSVVVERALFVSVFDGGSDYRVVGAIAAMHIGGGIIGAYIAMTIPFLIVPLASSRKLAWLLAIAIATLACYALIVTYARAAYGAAFVGAVATLVATIPVARGLHRVQPVVVAVLAAAGIAATVWIGINTPMMAARLQFAAPDFGHRERSWLAGLATNDLSPAAAIFGTGIGTYPRNAVGAAHIVNKATNFVLLADGQAPFVRLEIHSPLYLGQKIAVVPGDVLTVSVTSRTRTGRSAGVALCEKWLLYSLDCTGPSLVAAAPGEWHTATGRMATGTFGTPRLFGLLGRTVELSLLGDAGDVVDIRAVSVRTSGGAELLANGDFRDGLARWFFTDDDHEAWRIDNQYVALFTETGVLGIGAYAFLIVVTLAAAFASLSGGMIAAAPVVGAVAAFLFSGLFDYLFETPRLSALFTLICFAAIATQRAGAAGRRGAAASSISAGATAD